MDDFRLKEFLNNLEEGLRQEARELFKPETFERDQYIFIDQDEATHLYLVEEGTIEANIVHGDGKLYILNFLHSGNVFGEGALYDEGVYSYSAVAREDSRVWRVSWDDLQWLAERDALFALFLIRLVVRKLDQAYYKDRCIAGEKVERRIACVLLNMADEIGISDKCGLVIDTPLTNRDIAGLVGSTEETVSRIMSRLKKEEIMAADGKYLVVKDKESLRAYFNGI
ncbi:MAG: Crp/Fnr family transcriptional regulator [Actinomycetota bacterium]|nr:Crp/Fnr family transcriptional regulator [Actinomycetota bacterium]MDD5665755.1 Crp/Fnr family transcriptional regulator [Actinomycetota bacterium]